MKKLSLILLSASLIACGSSNQDEQAAKATPQADSDCRLAGTWTSNADKTLPAILASESLLDAQKEQLKSLVGRVSMRFEDDCKNAEISVDDNKESINFSIVTQDADSVTVADSSGLELREIRFLDNCLAIEIAGTGIDEYYCQ